MKSNYVTARLPSETFDKLKAAATEQGLGHSVYARRMIEAVLDATPEPKLHKPRLRPVRKVTIGVDAETLGVLVIEAKAEQVAISTWAGAVLAARCKKAPRPVERERRMISLSFHQLAGMARNINQMAKAMNRGILTGIDKTPAMKELEQLREEVQSLRLDLRNYAAGRYVFQTALNKQDAD